MAYFILACLFVLILERGMATGPFQSKLDPHYDQIAALRACKPPTTYARIAAILKEQHQLVVHRGTIQHFVKVRGTRAFYQLAIRDESAAIPTRKEKTTGKVPEDVLARMDALKQQTATTEEKRQPYLPVDGRLTYKEKP